MTQISSQRRRNDARIASKPGPPRMGVKARILPSRFQVARWVTCDEKDGGAKELQRFIDGNSHRVAFDAVDAPTVLVEYAPELRAIEANWPKIKFHALREHSRLVFQKQLAG